VGAGSNDRRRSRLVRAGNLPYVVADECPGPVDLPYDTCLMNTSHQLSFHPQF